MKIKEKRKWEEYSITKERFGFTASQNYAIGGIIFLVLFAMIAAPFYNSCIQKQTTTKLKTVHALLIQAKRNYDLENEDKGNAFDLKLDSKAFANEYFLKYIQVQKSCEEANIADCWGASVYKDMNNRLRKIDAQYSVVLPDRTVLGFIKKEDANANDYMLLMLDTNNKAGPNKLGRDIFVYNIYEDSNRPNLCDDSEYSKYIINNGIHTGGVDKCGIPHDVLEYNLLSDEKLNDGCNKNAQSDITGVGAGGACAAMIYMNQWGIGKDYPW